MRFSILLVCTLFISSFSAQDLGPMQWADSVLQRMTLEERVGQLFMERAYSQDALKDRLLALDQIKKYHIGGLCFFQGDPATQAEWIRDYQKESEVPLMVAIDAEWGLGMRFKKTTFSFPKQMTIGAVKDDELVYDMGAEIARHCKAIGVQVNFAPVIDINNNPANPVIHYRSFGEDRINVSLKGYQYMLGLESEGVLGCAKHFPGHGDTDTDSHYALPQINHDAARLDSLELFPFRVLSDKDVGSIMVAHLNIPALDSTPGIPSTLSKAIVGDILRDEMDYDGLVFTDAMDMKGVSDHYDAGEAAVMAFQAGNDIILLPADLGKAHGAIMAALKSGEITTAELNARVFRILQYKKKYPYQSSELTTDSTLMDKLHTPRAYQIKSQIYQSAITLLRNDQRLVPVRDLSRQRIASVSIGAKQETEFQKTLRKYKEMPMYHTSYGASSGSLQLLGESLEETDVVIVGLHEMSYSFKKKFSLTPAIIDFLQQLSKDKKVILTVFGTPYTMQFLPEMQTVLMCYEDDPIMESLAAQAIMGASSIEGVLPVTASQEYPLGTGISTRPLGRLGYGSLESVGLHPDTMAQISEIVADLIAEKAAPGCQVLVAKDGKIVWNQSYGHHTYAGKQPVTDTDLYDLASITKVAASTVSAMRLYDDGKLSLDEPVSTYTTRLQQRDKRELQLRDVMAHHAGLPAWIPFYTRTMTEDKEPQLKPEWYRSNADDRFSVEITDRIFMSAEYQDSMWLRIDETEIKRAGKYRYSDLGFYILGESVKSLSGSALDQYASETFYEPLGMDHTLFNPLRRYSKGKIIPSEEDTYFRKSKIHGHVHDMGAAMMSGVAGHAGLFSTASDLAILMQMLLNGGIYGGRQYLDETTIAQFTKRYPRSTRRGIGWDMKELDENRTINMAEECSPSTYGHLGFTGTAVWVDPEYQIIYIFLSNRTYPTMENKILYKNDYRPRIQSVIYRAMGRGIDNAHP